jgi:hypothetical protein
MMRRMVLGMLAVGLIGVGAAPAAAAPSGGEQFTITCGVDDFEVTMGPGLGVWTPAFVDGTDQVVIPYAISGMFGDRFVDVSKNAPNSGLLNVGCTFEEGFGGLEDGTVSFSLTPG